MHSASLGLSLLEDSLECFLGHFLGQLLHGFRDVGNLSDNALAHCIHSIGRWPMNGLAQSLHKLGALVENG